MDTLVTKLLDKRVIAAFIAALALVVGGILTFIWNKKLEGNKMRLEMKRKALLDALNLTDAILSHKSENNQTEKTPFSMKEVRECYNNLAVVVENKEVLDKFKLAWGFKGDATFDIIRELRNMVRLELGFGEDEIDLDISSSFLGYLPNSTPPKEKD
ncbi:hypothetical protein IFU39_00040 [Paenibacillus sp. CFBP 13594]|uniref:hypothetical protein n=1 Tax=Paenibacillus sp. CFBP 13594 TaxID=2774037 RepID=UPI0017836E2C|nr:hypothetical protein [Paenibacillus sp. CFBP 13594]MBD8836207.1 hypothetical protein [Paenibacillus sp. CFBP 13594]